MFDKYSIDYERTSQSSLTIYLAKIFKAFPFVESIFILIFIDRIVLLVNYSCYLISTPKIFIQNKLGVFTTELFLMNLDYFEWFYLNPFLT